jgi:hypothetical protein
MKSFLQQRGSDMEGSSFKYDSTPLMKCAKSEGGSGCVKEINGVWRVISNITDKLWPAKYGSEAKAEAGLRAYHKNKG